MYWWTLGLFLHLAIMNNAAISVGMQTSVWVPPFNCFQTEGLCWFTTYPHFIVIHKLQTYSDFTNFSAKIQSYNKHARDFCWVKVWELSICFLSDKFSPVKSSTGCWKESSLFFLTIHLFTCAYIVWVISPHCPSPPPSLSSLPCFQVEPVLPLSLILLKRSHEHSKKDLVFLLVELRIAIQKDS
jgi:hypothetical protein